MPAKSPERLKVYSAIDDSLVTDDVHVAGSEDIDDAVAAAKAAFPGWAATPPAKRAAILNKFADLLEANAEAIGSLHTICSGQPKSIATKIEPSWAAQVIRCK